MDRLTLYRCATGLATFLPGWRIIKPWFKRNTAGGRTSARRCYSIWMRHLTLAHERGLQAMPSVVAELGPGDSLGAGIAALFSGAREYHAFDAVAFSDTERNLAYFDEIHALFDARAPIPNEFQDPILLPELPGYAFPSSILAEPNLVAALAPARLQAIRAALSNPGKPADGIMVRYCAPWYDTKDFPEGQVEFLFSHNVMEHVTELPHAYETIHRALKPGCIASHHIDYKCHNLANTWNGHWGYGDLVWRCISGNRPYLLNRQPHSVHIRLMRQTGFTIVREDCARGDAGIGREGLAPRFHFLSDVDLHTRTAIVQARRNAKW